MEYLILNEASIPYPDRREADQKFPACLAIVSSAFDSHFKSLLLSGNLGQSWYEIPLAEAYPFREWLEIQEREYQRRVKSFITKAAVPQIPAEEVVIAERFALSEFFLFEEREISVPSLGAACLLGQLALSFDSHTRWQPARISLWHTELTSEGDQEAVLDVHHCVSAAQWQVFKDRIIEERRDSLRKGSELWDNREAEFPHIVFCGQTKSQLQHIFVSATVYNQLYGALTALNSYCEKGQDFSLASLKAETQLTISDESDTVKNNPRLSNLRTFVVGSEKQFFGFHIKNFSGAFRLHFYPNPSEKKMYIGYFGKHLPTAT
ncbi:MAG: hypothetical protein SF052_19440 [Bacteroidia bacterium]|nr:hypothetical protein [Bacteroidia bacterium]